jgi:hypothetical protein
MSQLLYFGRFGTGTATMSMHDLNDETPPADDGSADGGHEPASSLPRTLQEHLAQKLRSAYHELAEKPAFLGDPAIPVEFEYHLARLEAVEKNRHIEKVRNKGIEAVKSALEDIVAGPLEPETGKRGAN